MESRVSRIARRIVGDLRKYPVKNVEELDRHDRIHYNLLKDNLKFILDFDKKDPNYKSILNNLRLNLEIVGGKISNPYMNNYIKMVNKLSVENGLPLVEVAVNVKEGLKGEDRVVYNELGKDIEKLKSMNNKDKDFFNFLREIGKKFDLLHGKIFNNEFENWWYEYKTRDLYKK